MVVPKTSYVDMIEQACNANGGKFTSRPAIKSFLTKNFGIVDNATAAVGGAASAVKGVGANIVEKGGEVTGALGEKATGAASGVGAVISENFDAAVTFAKGLFGG